MYESIEKILRLKMEGRIRNEETLRNAFIVLILIKSAESAFNVLLPKMLYRNGAHRDFHPNTKPNQT